MDLNDDQNRAHREGLNVTQQEYANSVLRYSEQTAETSLYPGQLFSRLGKFLQRPFDHPWATQQNTEQHALESPGQFATLYLFSSSGQRSIRFSGIDDFRTAWHQNELQGPQLRMLFLRGQPSSNWVLEIATTLKVDAAIFQRYLEMSPSFNMRSFFAFPSLPSATSDVINLRFSTIGTRLPNKSVHRYQDVPKRRKTEKEEMDTYLHNLSMQRDINVGDSIVRAFKTYDEQFFSIEQQISISFHDQGTQKIVLVWNDAAGDLTEGPSGPWFKSTNHFSKPFLPILQHLPNIAMTWKDMSIPQNEQLRQMLPQSAALLHVNYGKTLDPQLMSTNAFYALHELFRFCANSTCQLLNMIESVISAETAHAVENEVKYNLSNLIYYQETLEEQARNLRESIRAIKRRDSSQGGNPKADEAAKSLFEDYEELLYRTTSLIERCKSGIAIVMSQASVIESKRGISQAKRVEQLSVLAFVYIPLSLTTSIFGMNLKEFNEGKQPIWLWAAVSAPVVALSLIMVGYILRSQN